MEFKNKNLIKDLKMYCEGFRTMQDAAKAIGVPRSTLFYTLKGRLPTVTILCKLLTALDKDVRNYFTIKQ